MKSISLLRKCIITVLGLCLILVSVLLFAGVKKASAFSLGTFEMDSGMYIKTKDYAGLRARVRMDSDTKSVIDEENNSLFFLLMTEDMFNAAETETSGEYDFSSYLNYNNFDTYGCVKIGANKNLIYYSSSDASYYSNLLIRDFPEKYLTIRLCIVAGITDGTNTEIAAFEPSQVCKVYYDVVNDAALSGFMSQINGIETYSSWYGTSGYPIVINNDSQYEDLRQIIMADINLSNKFIDISDNVERDQEFEEFSSITNKIAEEVDVNFDFDLSLSSSQGANIKQIDTNLAVADIQSVSLMNGTKIAFTRNTDTSELDFTSETINSLAKGDIPVRIGTSNKLYKAKFTVATEIIRTWERFKAITQNSAADDYYVLGADIVASDSVSGNRTGTFAGTLDGRGHIVSGITITGTAWTGHAFMQNLSGTIKNIALVDITTQYKANSYDSALLCKEIQAGAILDNIYLSGTVCSGSASRKTNGIFNARTGVFTIKNCIVKVENAPENVATTSYAIGANNTWATANMVNNCYVISSFGNLFQSAGENVVKNTTKYDDAGDFFDNVTAFESANGWSKYWDITSDDLNFKSVPCDLDITSQFSFARISGVYVKGGTLGKRNVNAALTSYISTNGFVDISAYQGKTLLITMPQSGSYGLVFYTTNADPTTEVPAISGVRNSTGDAGTISVMEITIPANANYLRTTYYSSTEGNYTAAALAKPFSAIIVNGGETGTRTLIKRDNEIRLYKIVIPDDATYLEEYAASEIAKYIKLSTNDDMSVVRESTVSLENDRLICVGDSALLSEAGVNIDKSSTGDDGFIIKSVDNDIFVVGGAGTGTVYGAYELLNKLIGFEPYSPDEIYYENYETIVLNDLDYDYTVTPSFATRSIQSLTWRSAEKINDALLMRVGASDANSHGPLFITEDGRVVREWGLWAHSIGGQLLPWKAYYEDHSDWYEGEEVTNGTAGYQIVMSDSGVLAKIVERIKAYFTQYPDAKYFMIGVNDNNVTPAADAGLASTYGGYGGVYIWFLNQIDNAISAWLADEGIDRDYKLIGLAYGGYVDAPVDGNGNPKINANDNVGIMVAPIDADWDNAIDAVGNTYNAKHSANIEGWGKVSDNLFIWSYSTSFREYLIYFNNIDTLQSYYDFYKDNGTIYLYDQGASQTNTPFKPLRDYVQSKLAWNIDITENIDDLIEAFIDNYYKVAAPYVKDYFDLIRGNYTALKNAGTLTYIYCGNNETGDLLNTAYWSLDFCKDFMDYVDAAIDAINGSALSANEKATLISRVKLDSIMPRYIMLSLYSDDLLEDLTTFEYKQMIEEFEADCEALGVKNYREKYAKANISEVIEGFKANVDGYEYNVYPDVVNGYLELTNKNDIAEYLYNHTEDWKNPENVKPVTLTWSGSSASYTVIVGYGFDIDDEAFRKETTSTSIDLYNLVPGIYCYKIIDNNDTVLAYDLFEVLGDMRMIYLGDGANYNMRDEGGYVGEFGKVKYEMLYRSADITGASGTALDILVNDLGIKTEIDLRLDAGDKTSPSEDIERYNLGIKQFDPMFPGLNSNRPFSQELADNLREIMLMLGDESNYPLVYHCAAGADRTGTLSFLIGGLLGLDYNTLVKDFEITSFYKGRRWRSAINEVDGVYSFDASGVMEDDEFNLVSFNKMYNHIMTRYRTSDGKLSSAIENYLITVVGLSARNIANIREILIEGYEWQADAVYESDMYDNLLNLGNE